MGTGVKSARTSGERSPGALNLVAACVVLALVISLSLRAAQQSPPAIAEFAPQAQQIRQAPSEQTSLVGNGMAGAGSGPGLPSPSPSSQSLPGNALYLHCVGDPPRQIEDPQSPPCIPFWVGDNGGATSRGVSKSVIRIAIPQWTDAPFADYQNFFNSRFEFYGRTLQLVDASANGTGSPDPATQRATANANAALRVFASSDYEFAGGLGYHVQASELGLVNTPPEGYIFDDTAFQQYAPYMWGYPMALNRAIADMGSWACDRLAGGEAVHAGPALSAKRRVFGAILLYQESSQNPTLKPLENSLAACGASLQSEVFVDFHDNSTSSETDAATWQNAMIQMQQKGVTSIFCFCHGLILGAYAEPAATAQAYYPEWLVDEFGLQDADWLMQAGQPQQQAHMFGVQHEPKWLPKADTPAMWAAKDEDPNYNGPPPNSTMGWMYLNNEYHNLLLLASGIQMAGPVLSAKSFAAGLHRTDFPNPATPLYAGHVGFSGGFSTMTEDGAEIYWSTVAMDPVTDRQGAYCYVDQGARHAFGQWPKGGDPFFASAPCDSGQAVGQGSG